MANVPKMSILLPSLNVISYIRECVESVLKQDLRDIEVICIDSGSTDGTLEVLREFEARDKRVKVLVSDIKSYGRQMNMGLDVACGEYIGIVETDDWVPSNMFSDLYQLAKKEDLDFVKADFYRFKERKDGGLDKVYNRLSSDPSFYNRVLTPGNEPQTFKFIMNTWSGIYKTEFLRRWHIRHNETLGASFQDNGFWFMTFCRAERVMFLDKPYYMNRRDNPNSSVYSKSKVWAMRSEYDYIRTAIETDRENLAKFIPLCSYFRFCGYYYNTIKRVAPEFRKEFLEHFSSEFRQLAEANELDMSLFSRHEAEKLYQVMYSPERFLAGLMREESRFTPKESDFEYRSADDDSAIKVSIVMPVYNVEQYLATCLDTILAQSMHDFEVICVNDGSTDGSEAILNAYAAKDSRIRVFESENAGPSHARNFGLSEARGIYVLFVDADDGLSSRTLDRLYTVAEKQEADVVVFGIDPEHYPSATGVPAWVNGKNPVRNHTFEDFYPELLFDEPGARPFAVRDFVRRSFMSRNNLWFCEDCRMGEDTIFPFEVFPLAKNITFIQDKLYYYRCGRPGSLMTSNSTQMIHKVQAHVKVVAHVSRVWDALGILSTCRTKFAEWAIDFVYNEFVQCPDDAKQELADSFIPVLRWVLSVEQQRNIGPGRQERVQEIEAFCNSSAAIEGDEVSIQLCNQNKPSSDVLVSIIVPAHNNELHIERTLKSTLGQTLEQIEVICIDDASTDATPAILSEYAQQDARLHVITYDENKTANQARKDGVMAARGQYILFCDGDDTIEPRTCEELYNEMMKNPVDILHFGTNVVAQDSFEEDSVWVKTNSLPYYGLLWGKQVFEGCFRGKLYGYNLWNKMYSSVLAKKAFAHVKDGSFPRGQDVYAFTLLAYFAESYRGILPRYYNYHLGSGMDGTVTLSPDKFSAFCSLSRVSNALKEFFVEQGTLDEYIDVWDEMYNRLIGDCINKWHKKVADEDKPACLMELLQSWPTWRVVEGVARRYWTKQDVFAKILMGHSSSERRMGRPKKIGMYYHKCVGGGVERVIEYLNKLYRSMGLEVVLITDIQGPEDKILYAVDGRTRRRAIPNAGAGCSGCYIERAHALEDIVEQEHIDVLIYHAWNTGLLLWDMLTAQSLGVSVLVHCHSVFSIRCMLGQSYFGVLPWVLAVADGLVCLSEVDYAFWSMFNGNVHHVINPLNSAMLEGMPAQLDTNIILWAGRLEPEKRPQDALRIFAKIYTAVPDACLKILGKAPREEDLLFLENLANELGIAEAVEFCGFQDDVAPYYKEASAYLMTSEFEGFPLALSEALMAGLPVVMYDLPYLTLVRDNPGIISVPIGDIDNAAGNLTRLLDNRKLRLRQGNAGRAFIEGLASYDYRQAWTEIFDSLSGQHAAPSFRAPEMVMWETLLMHYQWGVHRLEQKAGRTQNLARTVAQASSQAEEYREEIERIHSSATYKIGRIATWPVRKVRTFVNCIKEHGFHETMLIYTRRG